MKQRSINKSVIFFIYLLALFIQACGTHQKTQSIADKPSIAIDIPKELKTLENDITAYLVTSLDPAIKYPLKLNQATGVFTTSITVPLGSVFDLTIVYVALTPTSGEEIEIAHYVYKKVSADQKNIDIDYSENNSNWSKYFDLSPGLPNELNSDGDNWSNLDEILYGTDPHSSLSFPQALIKVDNKIIPPSEEIPETDTAFQPTKVTLDGSLLISQNKTADLFTWSCSAPGGFIFTSKKITDVMTLPDIKRSEDGRVILCNLTISNSSGVILSTIQTPISQAFVNKPPVTNYVTLSQFTDTNTGIPTPTNFKINWVSSDSDGDSDITSNELIITRKDASNNDVMVIRCSGLKTTQINFDQDLSGNCILPPNNHGELIKPFRLGALEHYNITVIPHDADGAGISAADTGFIGDHSLTGRWTFDEATTNDSSGESDNMGTLVTNSGTYNLFSTDTSPIMGKTLSLSKTKDRLSIPDTSGNNIYDFGVNDFTISLWYKDTQPNSTTKTFVEKYKAAGVNTAGFQMGKLSSGLPFFNTPSCDSVTSTINVLQNSWAHFVASRKDGKLSLFINGELAATKYCPDELSSDATLTFACNSAEHIDCLSAANAEEFNGQLDDIHIYRRSLAVDEVRRQCRAHDPTGNTCINERTPIIVQPEPTVILPGNHAFYSWRGEQDVIGNLLFPSDTYDLTYDLDTGNTGTYNKVNQLPDPNYLSDNYYIEKNTSVLAKNSALRLRVKPTGQTNALSAQRVYFTSNNLYSWWKLDGDYKNSSDNTLDFNAIQQLLEESTFTANGLLGERILFDGNDYITITNTNNFNFGSGDFTISLLYYPLTSGPHILIDKTDVTNTGIRLTYNETGELAAYTNSCGMFSGGSVLTQSPLASAYSHLLIRRKSGALGIFVNGQLEASGYCPSTITNTGQFTIGRNSPNLGPNNAFTLGYMDDVFVLNSSIGESAIFNEYCAYDASLLNVTDPPATPENGIAELDESCLK